MSPAVILLDRGADTGRQDPSQRCNALLDEAKDKRNSSHEKYRQSWPARCVSPSFRMNQKRGIYGRYEAAENCRQ